MRILHLIKAKQIGGAERHLLILLKLLRQRDVDVRLLLLVEPDNPMEDLVALMAERDVPVARVVIKHHADPLLLRRLSAAIREQKPDVLHTHLIHADSYGLLAGKMAGVPVIITSRHNDDAFRQHPIFRATSRFVWHGFTAGIVISEAMKRFVLDVEKGPQQHIHVVRYGLEHQPLAPQAIRDARTQLRQELRLEDDALLLGMACRLVEQKGVTYALQAFANIKPDYLNTFLVIGGDGPLRDQLETEARRRGLQKRVIFLGWRDDVPHLLRALDIFLMPSLMEGFGLVLLEAMSQRVPGIASDVSALPELVAAGETGLLIPPKDVDALAQGMRTLLDDRPLRLHMGMLAEDRVTKHFSAQRMADETLAVYKQYRPHRPDVKRRVEIS